MSRRIFLFFAEVFSEHALTEDLKNIEDVAWGLERITRFSGDDVKLIAKKAEMTPRQTEAFYLRFWHEYTLAKTANEMKVNQSRVSQLQKAALKRLRQYVAKKIPSK